jgi:hypothetical protein
MDFFSRLRATRSDEQNEGELVWFEAYQAALLEFNERRAWLAINSAMKAIERRKRMLGFSPKSAHERELLEHATRTLITISTHRVLPSPDNIQEIQAHTRRPVA